MVRAPKAIETVEGVSPGYCNIAYWRACSTGLVSSHTYFHIDPGRMTDVWTSRDVLNTLRQRILAIRTEAALCWHDQNFEHLAGESR